MTKAIIKFPAKRVSYAPRFSSRRFPQRSQENVAYKEDRGLDPDSPEAKLLEKIKGNIGTEIEKRGYANGAAIETAIEAALKGLNLEALRKYEENTKASEEVVRKLASEFEKVKNQRDAGAPRIKTEKIKELVEANFGEIEKLMRSKNVHQTIVLNTRAAAIMTMDNAIDVSAVTIPEDLIESFSVDSFIKKRRPTEWIFELVSRRTVAAITEYKTWLEEGAEDGAFAVIAEGVVKPLMSKSLVRNISKYRKIAGKRVYTEEFQKFRQEAMSIIEDLFNDKIIRDYNAVLVTSVMAKAASYVGTALDDQYTAPTDYHAIGAVAAQIETLEFYPDLLLLNPQDKWRIGLQQDTSGAFFVGIPVYNPAGTVTMMGFRVFASNRITVGTAILGESGLYKVEDEPIQIRMGYGIDVVKDVNGFVKEVTSDIDTNRFRIIAETFFHDYIGTNHLGSFVSFNFNTVKAALLKP